MYQATLETDHLIVKSIDTHADSDIKMYKSYFSNSKIMYVIFTKIRIYKSYFNSLHHVF